MSLVSAGGITIEGVRAELRSRPLRVSSEDRSWHGVALDEYASYHTEEMLADPRDHPVITICKANSPFVLQERGGGRHESPAKAGEATIIPAGLSTRWRGLLPAHLCMRLAPDMLEEVADELLVGHHGSIALINSFRVIDPVLQHFAFLFSTELGRADHPTQQLFMDSLATGLTVHLLRTYAAQGSPAERGERPRIAAIRRALDWVADNPNRAVRLEELAQAAGLSRFHFGRLFKAEVGVTPTVYVERSRIERAKGMIRTAELPIAHIAQVLGFADQAHFTRRFRVHVGQTPAAYAREHARGRLPPPYDA